MVQCAPETRMIVELDDVTKDYGAGVRALDGVTLMINAGERVGIMGPSGSGKSTLFGILGLLTAAVKGLFDTYFMSRTVAAVFGGYSVPFHLPVALMLLSIPIVAAVALIAAWWPARIAANTNVVAAIGAE